MAVTVEAIPDYMRRNFETMLRAHDEVGLAAISSVLVEDIPAGTQVTLIAAIAGPDSDGDYGVTPFGLLTPGNPYEMFQDPTVD